MQEKFSALQKIAREFNSENITWGVGGSLLLYIHGLSDQFEDIDLVVQEGDALACQRLLIKHGPMLPKNPDERFRTRGFFEFEIDGVDIDLMCVLSIVSHDMETVLPFDETLIERWEPFGVEKLPLMHLEDWYLIYALIEREPKLELIEGHFKAKGVNQQRLKQLLELNMPEKVRQRLTTWV